MRRSRSHQALTSRVFVRFVLGALALAAAGACDGGKTKLIGTDVASVACRMTPSPPPAGRFPPFYEKYLDAIGIPVLASSRPDDQALVEACMIAVHMLAARDDVRVAMIRREMRIGVIARDEVTTDLPDYNDLYVVFPDEEDWDMLRGVGATLQRPMSSAGEENLLCASTDSYFGENRLVQTFASSVLLGIDDLDGNFGRRLSAGQWEARLNGRWLNTFADNENPIRYYQMGVQVWFDATRETAPPDGIYNEIHLREQLRAYDPTLATLVAETMPDDSWRPRCP